MGQIHCKTCTCQESSRPRTGEFSCPNCFRPNNSLGWLRYHLKNQCEASPAQAREPSSDMAELERQKERNKIFYSTRIGKNITLEEYTATYGAPKTPKRKYTDPTRW